MLEMWEGALQVVLRVLIVSTRTFISRDLNYWVYCVKTLYKSYLRLSSRYKPKSLFLEYYWRWHHLFRRSPKRALASIGIYDLLMNRVSWIRVSREQMEFIDFHPIPTIL